MRKKIILLPLLMTIGLLSACAKDPKKVYEDQLQKQVNAMATKVGSTYRTVFEDAQKNNGYNVDYTLKDLKVLGEDFEDFKLALTADTYEKNSKIAATVSYDDEKMITGEMYVDPKKLYFMLPDYSKKALSVENEAEKELKLPEMPKADLIEAQLKDYGTMLVDTFQYTGCEKKAAFDENNYKFDATIMTGECTSKELEKTMEDISDKFEDSELNKSLEEWMKMGDVDPDDASGLKDEIKDKVIKDKDKDTKLQLKLYDGNKDNMAYEIMNTENKNRIVFVTDGTSWSIYCAEKDDIIADLTYHIEMEGKDISGYLKFAAKDAGALMLEFSNVKLSGKKISSCDYKLTAGEKEDDLKPIAEGKFAKDENKTTISVKIEIKELYELSCELEISISKRDAKSFELPTDSVDVDKMDEWSASFDMQKLESDFMKFNELYTKIQSIANPYQSYDYNEDLEDNSSSEDNSDSNNEGETNASNKESKFTYFSNYEDDGSYVYFNPLKEEVMAKGEPSTGLTIICRDPKAIKKIENYLAKTDMAKQNEKTEMETYTVSGTIGEDVSTWEQDTSYGMDWENEISYTKEALTGELSSVHISSLDKEFTLDAIKAVYEMATGEDGSDLLKEASDGYWCINNKDNTITAYVTKDKNQDNKVYYSASIYAY